MIKVLIADDHNLVRKGLTLLLQSSPTIKVVGEAADPEETVRELCRLEPDVVLMDLSFPGGRSGLSAIREGLLLRPVTKFIVLTMYDDEQYVRQAAISGAKGYLLKTSSKEQLEKAIVSVYGGKYFFEPAASAETVKAWLREADRPKRPLLTNRERDIVRLTALGYSNRDIAQLLHISVKTAENHKYKVMSKLNLRTKQQLIQYALKNNLMDLSH
ncbi:response regulator [Paenibacillus thermotolerans]|uniref:response regulator n=1 Tax=Paenibacillus thermotolerans TaxID=3027807 RepID=UPI0023675E24|nr:MULTISPECIES: response regulator transcription factor [unclassified Paenibacillus]